MAILRHLHQLAYRVLPLMRHPRVPFALKAGTLLAALVIVSPVDIFGDVPVLGLLDDAMLLALLATVFVQVAGWLLVRDAREPVRVGASRPSTARATHAPLRMTRLARPLDLG